ncbi:MAG: Lipoyl synthase, partial [uncultured Gemmatimonadetes bacterium]
ERGSNPGVRPAGQGQRRGEEQGDGERAPAGRAAAAGPPRAQAGVAQGAGAGKPQLPAPQAADARPGPPHRVRRGPLPQHRRVLGERHRHLHDPGRRVHPRLQVLRGRPRPPHRAGRGRAAPRGRLRGHHGAGARRGHLGEPRRAQERRRRDLRGGHPPDPRAPARVHGGGARPRLQGERDGAAHRGGGGAGDPGPQHRHGGAAVEAPAPRRALLALHLHAGRRQADEPAAAHQERHHPGDGRDGGGDLPFDARPARGIGGRAHPGPVPAPLPAPRPTGPLGHAGRVPPLEGSGRAGAGLRPRGERAAGALVVPRQGAGAHHRGAGPRHHYPDPGGRRGLRRRHRRRRGRAARRGCPARAPRAPAGAAREPV